MEYLIIVLVVVVVYLRFQMHKEDETHDEEFSRIRNALDTAISESPYKIEPVPVTKKKTRKRTAKSVVAKKLPTKKKRVVKKKVKAKTKRKTK